MPLPSYALVTSLENGRSLVLRINDRGPFNKGRVIDVSRRSAELLGFRRAGLARVRVEYLRPAPLDGDESYERHYLAMQPWVRCRRVGMVEAVGCEVIDTSRGRTRWHGGGGYGYAASGPAGWPPTP
jgi:rare lipoprotein A